MREKKEQLQFPNEELDYQPEPDTVAGFIASMEIKVDEQIPDPAKSTSVERNNLAVQRGMAIDFVLNEFPHCQSSTARVCSPVSKSIPSLVHIFTISPLQTCESLRRRAS